MNGAVKAAPAYQRRDRLRRRLQRRDDGCARQRRLDQVADRLPGHELRPDRAVLRHGRRRLRPRLRRQSPTAACTASTRQTATSPGATPPATTSTPARSPPTRRTRRPTVYFGSYDGSFYALDARNGDERWSHSGLGSISGAASLIGDTVYVADPQHTSTYGFDAANGHQVWTLKDGAYNPVISDGKDIFLTGYKTIYALSAGRAADQAQGRESRGRRKQSAKQSRRRSRPEEKLGDANRDPGLAHPPLRLGHRVRAVVEDRGAEHRVRVPVGRPPRPGGRARPRRRRRSPAR